MAKKTKRRPALVRLMLDNRRHWPGLIWLTALMLVSGLFKSLSADYLGQAVDQGMEGDFQAMSWSIGVTLLMVLADAVRLGVFNVETARTVERMFLDVKRQVFGSVAGCQLSAFEHGMQGGDVLSRVTDDLPALSRSFSETFTWLISVFCRGVVALAFCIGVSWELSAVYLVITPLLIWTMNKIGKPIQELQTKASRSGGKAYSIMSEMLQNNAAIKAFGAEEAMDQRFAGEVESQRQGLDQAARKGTDLDRLSLRRGAHSCGVPLWRVAHRHGTDLRGRFCHLCHPVRQYPGGFQPTGQEHEHSAPGRGLRPADLRGAGPTPRKISNRPHLPYPEIQRGGRDHGGPEFLLPPGKAGAPGDGASREAWGARGGHRPQRLRQNHPPPVDLRTVPGL